MANRSGDGRLASNWIQQDVLRTLADRQITIDRFPISVERLTALLTKVKAGELDTAKARDVFAAMLDTEKSPDQIMTDLGIAQVDTRDKKNSDRAISSPSPLMSLLTCSSSPASVLLTSSFSLVP